MGIYAMQIILFQDNRNIRISGSNLIISSLRQEHMNKVSKELEESETASNPETPTRYSRANAKSSHHIIDRSEFWAYACNGQYGEPGKNDSEGLTIGLIGG